MDEQKEIFAAASVKVNKNIIESGKSYEVIGNAADEIETCAIIVGVGEHFLLENLLALLLRKLGAWQSKMSW